MNPKGQKEKKIHKCEQCNKTFDRNNMVKRHIETVHKGKLKRPCEKCGKIFSDKYALTKHINDVHEKYKNYKCRHCKKSFAQAVNLKHHIKIVHEKKWNYKCKICGNGYERQKRLIEHTCKGEKNADDENGFCKILNVGEHKHYKCMLCTKSYSDKVDLKTHYKRVHKLNKCEHCGKSFSQPGSLKRHINTHHQDYHEQSTNDNDATEGDQLNDNESEHSNSPDIQIIKHIKKEENNTTVKIMLEDGKNYGVKIPGSQSLRLIDVKNVMPISGNFQYFFKRYDEDGDTIFDEHINDTDIVPLFKDKIIVECRTVIKGAADNQIEETETDVILEDVSIIT